MPHNLSIFSFQFSPPSARHYNSALSIWLSVDPMADKYPSTSPYTYCANNPVRLVDADGRKIDPASENEWDHNKQEIKDVKERLDNFVNEIREKGCQHGWSEKKIQRRTQEYEERANILQNTLDVMRALEESAETYTLIKSKKSGKFQQGGSCDKLEILYSSTARFVHEVTHAGQYHRHEIGFINRIPVCYDIYDEINAYQAAIAFDPWCYDNQYHQLSDVTIEWTKSRTSNGKYFPYKNLPERPINFNIEGVRAVLRYGIIF